MEPIVLGTLPDDVLHWRGTAAALAARCNELLPNIGLSDDAGSANERLVRHYVQVGVLSPPEREGREAIFDQRHIRQFLAARYLLKDGWSLAKITELVRVDGPDRLTMFVPGEREPTAAERALTRLKSAPAPVPVVPPPPGARVPSRVDTASTLMTAPPHVVADAGPLADPLRQAAEISHRRMSLQASLSGLGNASGRPERRRTLQITLTPWCQVYVDAAELEALSTDAAEALGSALTHALHEERIRRGDKS